MIRRQSVLTLIAFALLTVFVSSAIASHPFHVTRAEIDYNAKRKTFEVALCIWPEDLEKAVSKLEKRIVDIDAETEEKRNVLFKKYVAKSFRFMPHELKEDEDPNAAEIRWAGSEIKVKQGWLYFEVDASSAASKWTIENEMFFELNDDQMNHIEIRIGKNWTSETLSVKQSSVDWARE